MKQIKLLPLVILLLNVCMSKGQTNSTYEETESRFLKTSLNNIDSTAFEELGMNKVNALLDYSSLHNQPLTYNNDHNPFIYDQAKELFIREDSIPVELVLNKISAIDYDVKGKRPISKDEGAFYNIVIGTGSKTCSLHLVLMKAPKQFGKEEKMIWQVYLSKPVFTF